MLSMNYIELLRVKSWVKNLLIFTPLFFGGLVFDFTKFLHVLIAFLVFSLLASAVYIINDLFDLEQDRKHTSKKLRPLASGRVSLRAGFIVWAILIVLVYIISYKFIPEIIWIMAVYFILNILYSQKLKHIPIIDIVCVAIFFLIRILIGGVAAGVTVSYWLILCTLFLSLFLIIAKRLVEFGYTERRLVLHVYSKEFLKNLLIISSSLVIGVYSLYAVIALDSIFAIISIFFVLIGVLRYVQIAFTSAKAEYPEHVLIRDKVILGSVILWLINMFLVFYL